MPSIVPLIDIALDRPRHIRFDRRAVFASEVELTRLWGTERTFFGAMRDMVQALTTGDVTKVSLNDMSILLWQGLLSGDDPSLSLAQVQDMLPYMDPPACALVVGTLLEAWQAASPVSQAPSSPPAPAGEDGTPDPLAGSPGGASGLSSAHAWA